MKTIILVPLCAVLLFSTLSCKQVEDPGSAQTYYRLGVSFSKLGDFDQPMEYYENNVEKSPKSSQDYYELGVAYENAAEFDKAIASFQKAISLNPEFADAYHDLGDLYGIKGDYGKEAELLKRVRELNPSDSGVYYFSRISHGRRKIYAQARMYLCQAIKLKPDHIEAYYALAELYAKLSKIHSEEIYRDEELRCWEKIVKLKPEEPKNWLRLGTIFLLKTRYSEALRCFAEAIKHGSKDLSEIYANSGFIYMEKKEYAKALVYFEKVISIEPGNKDISAQVEKAHFFLNKEPNLIN